MVVNQKVTGTASSMPGGLALGGLAALAITVLGSVAAASLVLKEKIPEDSIGYCAMVILLVSSFVSARVSAARIKHRLLYVSMLSGLIYYGLLLVITTLFFGGQYQGMGATALVVFAGCGTAVLMGAGGKKQGSHFKKKMKRR